MIYVMDCGVICIRSLQANVGEKNRLYWNLKRYDSFAENEYSFFTE
jgi:hypothetical protein